MSIRSEDQQRSTSRIERHPGVTLTVASGVRVTQASECDVTVDGAVVLTSNAQWDADWHSADITVNGSLTMQAGSRLQVAGGAALTVNPSGTLTANVAEWLKVFSLQSYGYQGGLVVKGNGVEPWGVASLTMVTYAGKMTASALKERSITPTLSFLSLVSSFQLSMCMWYGEPGIETAELSMPQSARSAM